MFLTCTVQIQVNLMLMFLVWQCFDVHISLMLKQNCWWAIAEEMFDASEGRSGLMRNMKQHRNIITSSVEHWERYDTVYECEQETTNELTRQLCAHSIKRMMNRLISSSANFFYSLIYLSSTFTFFNLFVFLTPL